MLFFKLIHSNTINYISTDCYKLFKNTNKLTIQSDHQSDSLAEVSCGSFKKIDYKETSLMMIRFYLPASWKNTP